MRPNSDLARKERDSLILSQKQQQIDLHAKIMQEKDKRDMKIEGINARGEVEDLEQDDDLKDLKQILNREQILMSMENYTTNE